MYLKSVGYGQNPEVWCWSVQKHTKDQAAMLEGAAAVLAEFLRQRGIFRIRGDACKRG